MELGDKPRDQVLVIIKPPQTSGIRGRRVGQRRVAGNFRRLHQAVRIVKFLLAGALSASPGVANARRRV